MMIKNKLKQINKLWKNSEAKINIQLSKKALEAEGHDPDDVEKFISWYYKQVDRGFYQPLTGEQRYLIELYDQFLSEQGVE